VAIARASSGYPSAIVYNSNSSFSEHARAGFCMRNASVSHNGVDIPDEALIAEWRRAIRAQIGAGDGVIVYVHLGRAHPDKGIDDFVKAAKLVHAQLGSRAVFVRVGRPGWINGQSLESCALERSTLLYHAGEQPESRPWLAAADVCVMTSVRESCPNVVLESMSAGTPVVATDVGDAALIVGECGWIVQPNSPQAIANAMITAASTIAQPHHRARLWKECRMAMSDRYCRQRVADRQVAIYRDVVRSSIGTLST
jgi:glycosyltransferase involved in cell wall biosynthesis